MTATFAGAVSHAAVDWHAIDWQQVNQNVRRLQARIVKATQAGRWGKVKALHHLLTRSFSGKALAVKRVTENQGKRTAGVDGETWNTPDAKQQAIGTLRQRGYQPRPLRRVSIPKSNGKMRPLGIPTLRDRAMQALYLLALDPIAETTADPNSYGFRPGRSTADAIEQCFTTLGNRHTAEWVLEGDIKACFDRISHDWLLAHIPMDKAILQKWLKAGFMDKHVLYPTEEGTPQGGVISPVLANLTLDGLEQRLRESYPKSFVKGGQKQVNLVRYADDFIITGRTKELLEDEVKPLVEAFLRARGLELSQEKTSITHLENGFDFLGQQVRKYGGKLIIKPSRKNVATLLRNVRGIVKANKQATAANLISLLNPVLRGWATFHRHVSSKETFYAVDHALFVCLWRWALRRHPNKGRQWVRKKYFRTIGSRQWRFFGEKIKPDRSPGQVGLFYPGNVAIQRHVKIKGQANPYDPTWEMYFEARLGVKMSATLKGRRQLLYLWKEQNGRCPVCNEKITELTGWHNHHIVGRSKGGADRAENRVLLHPNCHSQIHAHEVSVVKPRPTRGE